MKKVMGIVLLAAFALGGCAPQPDAAKTDLVQADQAKKKRCANQTGSRLAPCGEGSTGDYVSGESGNAYRDDIGRRLLQHPG